MNEQWQKISDVYGPTLVSFCKHWNITPIQTKNGAFYINDEEILQKYKKILLGSMHSREIIKEDEEVNKDINDVHYGTNSIDFIGFDHFINCTKDKIVGSLKSSDTQMSVGSIDGSLQATEMRMTLGSIDNILQRINISIDHYVSKTQKEPKFPKTHILEASINGKEIFQYIMDFCIDVYVDGYENCIPLVVPILECFQKHHKRFNYYSLLKNIIQIKKNDAKKKEISVPIQQIKRYFQLIFHKVVPLRLFGNNRNKKKMLKVINQLMDSGRYECITLKSIINKLKIADVDWLKPINNSIIKQSVFAKVVYWFLTEFIKEILYTQFYITNITSTGSKKIYIPHGIWKTEKAKFIRKLKRKLTIMLDDSKDFDDLPIAKLVLLPKLTGVRPILQIKYSQAEKKNLRKVSRFLEQLYITHYNQMTLPRFHKQWKTTVQCLRNSTQKHLHNFVSCDVKDAYGSINCDKLFEIVTSLCDSIPDKIRMESLTIMKRRDLKSSRKLTTRQYFVNRNLQLSISANTLFSPTKDSHSETIRKDWLMTKIKNHIFHQKVWINNKKYLLIKGVAQGALLSAVLCDIYYSHMVQHELSKFLKTGTLYRYVDDFLYVTDNEDSAKRFLDVVEKGISGYNCQFKPSKTQTSLQPRSDGAETLIYLGYNLNMKTLEATPKYLDVNARYTTTLSYSSHKTPTAILQRRLNNIASLKLTNIVLDDEINSMTTILETLRRASLLQASRCLALILRIFDDTPKSAQDIFKAIKFSNNKIVRTVGHMYMTDKEKRIKITKELKYLLWDSYKKVFNKRPNLYKTFNWRFTREISHLLL
ncbi:telomerase reverse transcriptase isoform X2 [Cephus cinctus]|uniref:Telomerase reverse transcriptase n=1 Tax=Cephus cinctus TaxID=211228 RepID=A0AAJ7BP69_CEPCN|nr:telomerase reverse transcriptase isoform X2 [Cephus cinctus]